MVKQSPFQADLFTIDSIEKQVEKIKSQQAQTTKNTAEEKTSPDSNDDLFQQMIALESRVDALEKQGRKKRWSFL